MQWLVLEAITINWLIILFIMTYAGIFSARILNIWNSLPNSIVDASTVIHHKEPVSIVHLLGHLLTYLLQQFTLPVPVHYLLQYSH